MSHPLISFRAPQSYHDRLAELAESTGQSPADVLRSLIANATIEKRMMRIPVAVLPVAEKVFSAENTRNHDHHKRL